MSRAPGGRLRRAARTVPFTLGYGLLLTVGGELVERLDGETREGVLRTVSTNLHNLSAGHLETLVTSALLPADPGPAALLPVLAALLAGEVVLGTRRALVVFAVGHVGASLAVAGLLGADALPGVVAGPVRFAVDAGPSYGAAAVVGAVLVQAAARVRLGPPAARLAAALAGGAVVAATARPLGGGPTFTDWGHLLGLAAGAALAAALLRRRAPGGRLQPAGRAAGVEVA